MKIINHSYTPQFRNQSCSAGALITVGKMWIIRCLVSSIKKYKTMLRLIASPYQSTVASARRAIKKWLFLLIFFSGVSYAGVSASPANSSGTHTISWTSVANTDHYTVAVSGERSGSYNVGGSLSKSFTETSNGTYTYKVTAWGEDVWRPAIQEWVPGPPTNIGSVSVVVTIPVPFAPSSINIPSTDNNGSFSISWGGV